MQVSPDFDLIIKEIQGEFMERREKRSTVDVTEELSKRKEDLKRLISSLFDEVKITFDRRKR